MQISSAGVPESSPTAAAPVGGPAARGEEGPEFGTVLNAALGGTRSTDPADGQKGEKGSQAGERPLAGDDKDAVAAMAEALVAMVSQPPVAVPLVDGVAVGNDGAETVAGVGAIGSEAAGLVEAKVTSGYPMATAAVEGLRPSDGMAAVGRGGNAAAGQSPPAQAAPQGGEVFGLSSTATATAAIATAVGRPGPAPSAEGQTAGSGQGINGIPVAADLSAGTTGTAYRAPAGEGTGTPATTHGLMAGRLEQAGQPSPTARAPGGMGEASIPGRATGSNSFAEGAVESGGAKPQTIEITTPGAAARRSDGLRTADHGPEGATVTVLGGGAREAGTSEVSGSVATRGSEPPARPQLLDQLLEHAASLSVPRNTRLRVQLRPPELGWLDLRLGLKDGVLSLQIAAESARTRGLIEVALPQLRQALQARHIQLGDLTLSSSGSAAGWLGNPTPSYDPDGQWSGTWRRGVVNPFPTTDSPEAADAVAEGYNRGNHLVDYRV